MAIERFSDRAMFEQNFDHDVPPERLSALLAAFSEPDRIDSTIRALRSSDGFVDLKRGELYPEVIGAGIRLRRTIAEIYGVDDGAMNVRAQPNFGCNGCIASLFATIRNLEDTARLTRARTADAASTWGGCVAATPTYFRYYTAAQAFGLRFIGVPYPADQAYPVDRVLSAVEREDASLVIIASPENPSGVPLPDASLDRIMAGVGPNVIVVLDRTCACLTPEVSTKELLDRFAGRRFGVFHSFSKYHALSHLRIGFAVYASDELARETNRYVPFGLCLESALRATEILQRDGEMRPSPQLLARIRRNKEIMGQFLAAHPGFWCSDFQGNYALMRLPAGVRADELAARLLSQGVFVLAGQEFPEPGNDLLRLHVGGPEDSLESFVRECEQL
jgi:histidinol-phosphate/aromatic aminotransferase/cobyric acid decarboxylase-like protein